MNDEAGASEPQESSSGDAAQQAVSNFFAQLTNAERVIGLAVLLVVLVNWIFGSWLLDEQGLSNSSYLIPLGMLAAMWFYYSGSKSPWHTFYPWLLGIGAWAMAVIGLDNLIFWLRSEYSPDGWDLFLELVFTAAGVLFAIGAWQLRSDNR